ncbi:MAG: hypothetical protein K6T28_02590 [Acidothermus sp.]|nr:hypothetical protein [Acidothermus sp.]
MSPSDERGRHGEDAHEPRPSGDPRLEDPTVLEEIELYSELIIQVRDRDRPLSLAEVDRILGLSPASRTDRPPTKQSRSKASAS